MYKSVTTQILGVAGRVNAPVQKHDYLVAHANGNLIKRKVAGTTTRLDNDVLDLMHDTFELETP